MKRLKIFISIALFFAIVLSCIPISVIATEIEEIETPTEAENDTVVQEDTKISELVLAREESVKHFKLPDGTYEAVSYGQAVHRKDADGVWQDINNDLTLTTVGTKEIYSTPDSRVSFDKESNALTLSENGYSIYMSLLSQDGGNMSMTTEPMNIEVVNRYENRSEYYDTLEEAIEVNNRSSITYSNVMNGTDIEYVMNGNDIKENIIVKTKKDSYEYGFMLALHGLVPILENNVIILKDETTNEEKYIIPAPYMYDSNDMYSYDVEYGLIHAGGEKYLLTVTADEEWINDEARVFPVTIDPTINGATIVYDTQVDSVTPDYNYGTRSIISLNSTSIGLFRNTIPSLPEGATLNSASFNVYYTASSSLTSKTVRAYQITQSWVETTATYNNRPNYNTTALSSYNFTYSAGMSNSNPGSAAINITTAVSNWYNGASNYGIALKEVTSTEYSPPVSIRAYDYGSYRPSISINYEAPVIEDGIYAFQSVYSNNRFITIENDSTVAGNNLQQASYSLNNGIPALELSNCFELSRMAESNYYIIRSHINTDLSLEFANNEILTKILPFDSLTDQDAILFEWNGIGYNIVWVDYSVPVNTKYVVYLDSLSSPNLTYVKQEANQTSYKAAWNLVKMREVSLQVFADEGYATRFGAGYKTQIASVIDGLKNAYLERFNILIDTTVIQDFKSKADECGTGINEQCTHASDTNCSDDHHKSVIAIFNNCYDRYQKESNFDTSMFFIGHSVCKLEDNVHTDVYGALGVAKSDYNVSLIIGDEAFDLDLSIFTAAHEFGHLLGMPDHYGIGCNTSAEETAEKGRIYSSHCMYGELAIYSGTEEAKVTARDSIRSNFTICDGCRYDMMANYDKFE